MSSMGGLPPGLSIIGTPVDPASPGGELIAPDSELADAPFEPATLLFTGGVWTYVPPVADTRRALLTFSRDVVVPAGTPLFLEVGAGLISSSIGLRLPSSATLKGIAVTVNTADATRTFDIEAVKNPTGTPVILATLPLALSTISHALRTFNAVITATDLIGVRVTRTGGVGASSFSKIAVALEVELP